VLALSCCLEGGRDLVRVAGRVERTRQSGRQVGRGGGVVRPEVRGAALSALDRRSPRLPDRVGRDLGGPEVMSYRKMMERVAHIRGKRPLLIEVPFLTPRLSSLWLYLVTPASVAVARPLVDGLRIPTVAHDDRIWELVGVQRTTFDEAIRAALLEHG